MHRGTIKEDLKLQYRGQEPGFSCQIQWSSTGLELAVLLSRIHIPVPMPHSSNHAPQHSCIIHTDSLNSSFYSISGTYPVFIVDKSGLEYKNTWVGGLICLLCLYAVLATNQSSIDRSTKIKTWAVNIFHLHLWLPREGGLHSNHHPHQTIPQQYKGKITYLLVIAKHLTFINTYYIYLTYHFAFFVCGNNEDPNPRCWKPKQ